MDFTDKELWILIHTMQVELDFENQIADDMSLRNVELGITENQEQRVTNRATILKKLEFEAGRRGLIVPAPEM